VLVFLVSLMDGLTLVLVYRRDGSNGLGDACIGWF